MTKGGRTAAKRAEMRNQPEEDPEFQIAPMIDILLVLLVFFMSISSTEVLQSNDQVKLPVAKDASDDKKEGKAKGQAIVNVLWNPLNNAGSIDVDNRAFATPSDMVPYLQSKMAANPNMRVLVRADKGVRFEYMKQLLRQLGAASVVNVTFSVVDKDTAPPPRSK
jgi:biopolymer transport protein ExbD